MNKEPKVYYKLVNKDLESWIASGILKTKYKVGEKVLAKEELLNLGYGLTVFKDLKSLREFQEDVVGGCHPSNKVYSCKIGKRLKRPLRGLFCVRANSAEELMSEATIKRWPNGTIMTDSVKLIEEVTL